MKKKLFKRVLSVLLSAVLVVTAFPTMFAGAATEDKDKIFLQCFDNEDLKCTVLILTFDKAFTKIGEELKVSLTTEKDNTITIEDSKILREFHKSGAQLFIALPSYLSDEEGSTIPTSSMLTVSEGAFVTEKGELSPEYSGALIVSTSVSRSTKEFEIVKDVAGAKARILQSYMYGDTKFSIGDHPDKREDKVVVGAEMYFVSANWAWDGDEMEFTENGELTDVSTVVNTLGDHTIKGKLNDFIYDTFSFKVVSEEQARKDYLKITFKQSLRSVYVIPLGLIIGFTIPGMFMIAGQLLWIEKFFTQLFSKELVDDYYTALIK